MLVCARVCEADPSSLNSGGEIGKEKKREWFDDTFAYHFLKSSQVSSVESVGAEIGGS